MSLSPEVITGADDTAGLVLSDIARWWTELTPSPRLTQIHAGSGGRRR